MSTNYSKPQFHFRSVNPAKLVNFASMRIAIILCSLLLLTELSAEAQSTKVRKHYKINITDSTFVQSMPEQGASFTAYFKQDSLYKVETRFYFNFGEVARDYFYWRDSISLINETQKLYNATALPKVNADTVKVTYSGRYIFQHDKLTGISQKGSYSISDTPQSKDETEVALRMLAYKYKALAYERAKSKKNRIKLKKQPE